ncbi:MAG: T9SS type A sorting domain-containing protein [Calditrichaeota bacterium]|nr:T9SS type A sorting domain-containing protein [Calditrichota bacterium]
MNQKLHVWVLALLFSVTALLSQNVVVVPYGVSDRDVARDSLGIFDTSYNGLLNVGVETKMYFKGTRKDGALTAPTWTITLKPDGSTADFIAQADLDESTQFAAFKPDLEGVYVIEFSDGEDKASLTVHAGLYMGIEDGKCGLCHSKKVTEWELTGHYSIFEEGMKGTLSPYYASYCIRCHTTGNDAKASNNGFDDRTQYVPIYDKDTTFVFPSRADLYDFYGSADSSLYPGVWDSLFVFYPNSMKLSRIQCESCHGPGSDHFGDTSDSRMVASLNAANCAYCHDSGTHHVYPEQWDISGHAHVPSYPGGNRTDCRGCHNGGQFVQYAEGEEITKQPYIPITCATCHDPHSDENEHQVRTVEVTLSNGMEVTDGGLGKLCMNCHQNRREAKSYSDAPHKYYGPHYAPQADMLLGVNAITFGKRLPSSPHAKAVENTCVDCHMSPAKTDEDGNVILVGAHTFNVKDPEGNDNVKICQDCHGDVGTSFAEKKFYFNGNADHDGDGVEEGLQMEVRGLMEKLAQMLPHPDSVEAYDPHDDVDETWTRTELKAAFNYEMVYYDGSYGIHNPAFTVALLKTTIKALENSVVDGQIVAIDDVPNDQGKQVKIIWNKFADDGVAVDPVELYIVKRYDEYDDTWTGVGQHPADGSHRYALVVPTLFDSTADGLVLTKFKVLAKTKGGNIIESEPAEGYSVDNLIPHAPVSLAALVANNNVELSWEAPEDPDINYYRVFRSTEPNFVADASTELGTTADLSFVDRNLDNGEFYYKVRAVDFSGNQGELSAEVTAKVTGIENENTVVTKFDLAQNYPNPFNPKTTIEFSILKPGHVTLAVYSILGEELVTLVDKNLSSGNYSISFNGNGFSSGVYFYRIYVTDSETGAVVFQKMHKMILMK